MQFRGELFPVVEVCGEKLYKGLEFAVQPLGDCCKEGASCTSYGSCFKGKLMIFHCEVELRDLGALVECLPEVSFVVSGE